jgi:hypothetical protein
VRCFVGVGSEIAGNAVKTSKSKTSYMNVGLIVKCPPLLSGFKRNRDSSTNFSKNVRKYIMQIRMVTVVALFRPDKRDEARSYLWQFFCECAK